VDLGDLGGGDSYATGINNSGQIVGGAATAGGQGHAFLYDGGTFTDVGAEWPGGWSAAYGVNDAGAVAGYGELAPGVFRGFLWDEEAGITTLGTLGGASSYAFDINDSGQVVGHASLPNGYLHAFFYDGGVMTDLGTLGGGSSFAYGVNDAGDVVGYSWWDGGPHTRAFLWSNGFMTDLNELLLDGANWELLEAYAINNAGQIVGAGIHGGQRMAFRLDPVPAIDDPPPALPATLSLDTISQDIPLAHNPEPNTAVMVISGLALITAGFLRRRRNSP